MARNPIPKELHIAAGTDRADRHGAEEAARPFEYLSAPVDCPSSVPERGRERWYECSHLLIAAGVLTKRDLPCLELYCQLFGLNENLLALIRSKEEMYDGQTVLDDDEVKNAYQQVRSYGPQMLACMRELGLSVLSRTKQAAESKSGPATAPGGRPPLASRNF